eukprot:2212930-Prymnesium_polylepis.3
MLLEGFEVKQSFDYLEIAGAPPTHHIDGLAQSCGAVEHDRDVLLLKLRFEQRDLFGLDLRDEGLQM